VSRVVSSPRGRFAIVAAVLVIFFGGSAFLLFGNQGPPPQQRLFQVSVVGNTMSPSRLQANYQDTLTVSVQTDKAEEIHLHGYDKHFFSTPGQPATITFSGDKTGDFVIEIEATSTPLGLLQIQPRAGFLGLGQPPNQSSTTVHANPAGTLIQVGSTTSYNLSVVIGSIQAMFTPAQVASQHPKTGEVMFSGQMTMPPGMDPSTVDMGNMPSMNIPPEWRHLEAHIYDKKTGDVVKTLTPVITLTNKFTGMTRPISMVTMQGVIEGPGDFHYGNNVDLPTGQYTVTVAVGSESANFDFNV
jgi:hypothetical protein